MNGAVQIEDLIKMLLLSSEPCMSSLRTTKAKKPKHLDEETRSLIGLRENNDTDSDTESDSEITDSISR